MRRKGANRCRASTRRLRLESLEGRLLLAVDLDDTISESVSLGTITTTPVVTSESVSPDTDVDIYRVRVIAGQVVDFDIDTVLNGPGAVGSYLRLFNVQGQELASNNDGAAPGENFVGFDAYLRFTFTTGGNYYIGVSNVNNIQYDPITGNGDVAGGQNATGAYQLTVTGLPDDTDDSLNDAFLLGAITTTAITRDDIINPDIDVDIYRFTVTNNQTVDFDIDTPFNGPAGLGSYIRLFNPQGQQLAFNNDGVAPGESQLGFDSYLRHTFTSAGTYYLGVSNANNIQYDPNTGNGDTAGGQFSIGAYQLIVQSAPVVTPDQDDTLSSAFSLGSVTTTPIVRSDSILPDVDVDMYRFSVLANMVVDFDIDTTQNGPGGLGSYLRLFNAQGQQLAFNDDAAGPGENTVGFDAYLRFTFATAATYYLGVSNNTNIQYNPSTGGGDTSGGVNATGNYQLIVQAVAADPDDSISEAVNLNNTISGAISPDGDVDMYRVSIAGGFQVVDFDIDTPLNGPGGLGSFLRLFDAQGNELAFNDDSTAPGETQLGFDSNIRFIFPTAGLFYIGVSGTNNRLYNANTGNGDTTGGPNSTGDYQLTLTTRPEQGDTIGTATPLGSISDVAKIGDGTVNPSTYIDMFSFTVGANQTVDFDIDTPLDRPERVDSYIRLFNASGTELAANDNAAGPNESPDGFDAYLRFTFVSAGTYYMGVSNKYVIAYNPLQNPPVLPPVGVNAVGDFQLSVRLASVADPDDTLAEAQFLGAITTTGTGVNDSISPQTDVDMYRFTVTAGQVVDFDIDTPLNGPGGLGSFLRLFDSQGTQLTTNDDGNAPGENVISFDSYFRFTFGIAGTYYIGVSNNNNTNYNPVTGDGDVVFGANATGTYQLIVRALPVDTDDSLIEATFFSISSTPVLIDEVISPDIDVDIYQFSAIANQVVDFDIDTILNGPGGLGSYLRLFNSQGQQIAFNDDGNAPGENVIGFDAYLRFTFTTAGTYYIGVSNNNNIGYNPLNGQGDVAGGFNTIGSYRLTVQNAPVVPPDPDDTLAEAVFLGPVPNATFSDNITPDVDVDLFRFTVTTGQVVDFDIDTTQNGPGGLGSFLRLFNAQGLEIASNNDAAAPGESQVGFDAYLQFTFTVAGTYYLGVSNANNIQYDPTTGNGDTAGGENVTGSYQLTFFVAGPAPDPDDAISEALSFGLITTTPASVNTSITPDTDVDMYSLDVVAGQTVDFDIDTAINGPGGLGSYLRLFNGQGQQLAFNNDAAAPGEPQVGLDAYLRFTFTTGGTYYIAVSNSNNTQYSPSSGDGDTAGGQNSVGNYQLTLQSIQPTLILTLNDNSIPEFNGTAIGTVTRINSDLGQSLVVALNSSDTSAATVPGSVLIPANQTSITFTITAVDDHVVDGTDTVTITASASAFVTASSSIDITDSNGVWHNAAFPADVDNDGILSPIDALTVINYINELGPGSVPATGSPPPFYDVSSDNLITPIDALIVINELNAQSTLQLSGEDSAESGPSATSAIDAVFATFDPQSNPLRVRRRAAY